jgi:hypothetical protein
LCRKPDRKGGLDARAFMFGLHTRSILVVSPVPAIIDRWRKLPLLTRGLLTRCHRAGFRLEFVRWFVGVNFFSVREAEPNHPRHHPTEAPATSSTTRRPTRASFTASRRTRRATRRKSATATKAISPVVMAIVILEPTHPACGSPASLPGFVIRRCPASDILRERLS